MWIKDIHPAMNLNRLIQKKSGKKKCISNITMFFIGIINYGMQITIKEHNKAKNDQNIKCQFIPLII